MMMMMKRGEGTGKRKEAKFLIALDVQSRFSESNESPTNVGKKEEEETGEVSECKRVRKRAHSASQST